jgi:tRNA/tmRNA/rRNA uracil-C5-methylase (TrmA/RlmC/RlmD family)
MTDLPVEGDEVVITTGPIVHGGHCIAHHGQLTLFVRYAMPGEQVLARITRRTGRIGYAIAVDILRSDERRITPSCAVFGSSGCGGCEWQYAPMAVQRAWKRDVLHEAFRRQAGTEVTARIDWSTLVVEALEPGADSGLGWRVRARWQADEFGRLAFRRAASHDLIPIDNCPVLVPALQTAMFGARAVPAAEVVAQAGTDGSVAMLGDGSGEHAQRVMAQVRDRTWNIRPDAFWQAHQGLPGALVSAVLEYARPTAGECWWDLYSGVGLFSAFLGEVVGEAGSVHAVEDSQVAHRCARRSLHDLPQVRLHRLRVEEWLADADRPRPRGVVVDPPRRGLGPLVARLCAQSPERIVLVACDPVSLARDAAAFSQQGYQIDGVRAFDAFPMTHHFECVALFRNSGSSKIGPQAREL